MNNPKYITKLERVPQIAEIEPYELHKVSEKYAFRTNEYYLSLINWDDPDDPIRRIVIPDKAELETWGCLDASNEKTYTRVLGLEHKYEHTAILLVTDFCGGYCRFCFRKRIFMNLNDEVVRDISEGLNYIRTHKELNNILLTGGDPLLMSTRKLEKIIMQLREIDHVYIIRIGSKIPAFNPYRILNDPSLPEMLNKYSTPEKKIYLMTHFNHPRELTDEAMKAMHMMLKAGVILANQTPIIRGVNDSSEVLGDLFDALSFSGIPPYYVFQCRPTEGNKHLSVPVERGYIIHEQAKMRGSGLAKRSRFVMSHALGKIEVLGLSEDYICFRYHRAANSEEKEKFIVCKRNPEAYWFDDYTDMTEEYQMENPFLVSSTVQESDFEEVI
ncbi:MAG TPA: KamA family radical SAM protein [Anaerolineae bacterium]|nr:KamA family radical SAM protein [Anaerolineae bacterium]